MTFVSYYCFLFFFKQKTAYEMRISDWSSDVCSSDLLRFRATTTLRRERTFQHHQHMDPAAVIRHPCISAATARAPATAISVPNNPSRRPYAGRSTPPRTRAGSRSEERRGGKEGVSTCSSRGSP